MIPLLHDLADETVLVFGGGPVGARRARTFASEARVIVVSPAFADEAFGGAERVRAAPAPADVAGWIERAAPVLVVAATDRAAVNDAVAAAGRDRGLLVNRADRRGDRRDPGSVAVPATARDGPVVVAVGTGGESPTLSRHLRATFEAELAGAGAMAGLLADLREELSDWPADRRREALSRVVGSAHVWKALGGGGANGRQLAEDVIEAMGERE